MRKLQRKGRRKSFELSYKKIPFFNRKQLFFTTIFGNKPFLYRCPKGVMGNINSTILTIGRGRLTEEQQTHD